MSLYLADHMLTPSGSMSAIFIAKNIFTYEEACLYIESVPYGRITDKSNLHLVVQENKGVCSTKHALLKELANEQGIDVDLIIGIYSMKESNTPGVGEILKKYGLDSIPEAHCYLKYQGNRMDFTGVKEGAESPFSALLLEQEISITQIGEYKENLHRSFISDVYGKNQLENIWRIRELCIHSLSA